MIFLGLVIEKRRIHRDSIKYIGITAVFGWSAKQGCSPIDVDCITSYITFYNISLPMVVMIFVYYNW